MAGLGHFHMGRYVILSSLVLPTTAGWFKQCCRTCSISTGVATEHLLWLDVWLGGGIACDSLSAAATSNASAASAASLTASQGVTRVTKVQ